MFNEPKREWSNLAGRKPGSPSSPASTEQAPTADTGTRRSGKLLLSDGTFNAPAAPRMVHYNGYVKLKVTEVAPTFKQVADLADAAGGYVEALTASSVTVRVPVAEFRNVYGAVSKLAEVVSRSLTAQDVTDAYAELELRLRTLRASRERLIKLLATATRPKDKLEILAQVQRLTTDIDQLDMQLTTLVSLAELSRLTVEAELRQVSVQDPAEEPVAAFRFMHELSPFRRDVALAGKPLELAAPAGMVALTKGKPWAAEGPDGAVMWASTRTNEPHGTTEFWLEALKSRLPGGYASSEELTAGSFRVLRLVDGSEAAYRYLVAVRADGDELQLVEVYYPSATQEKRYAAAVQEVIARGAP